MLQSLGTESIVLCWNSLDLTALKATWCQSSLALSLAKKPFLYVIHSSSSWDLENRTLYLFQILASAFFIFIYFYLFFIEYLLHLHCQW